MLGPKVGEAGETWETEETGHRGTGARERQRIQRGPSRKLKVLEADI